MASDKAPSGGQTSAAAIVGRAAVIAEAEAILARYEPSDGKGQSLSQPSQGEARRMLSSVRALLYLVKPVAVSSSPLELVTR